MASIILINFSETDTLHLGSVNDHIMPRIGYTILSIIMALSSTFGIILNMVVIIVTVRYKQLRQPLNYALVNLAVADLGCPVFGGLLTAVTNAMGYFSLGRVGCVLEGFAVAFFGIAGLCSVAVIAVDRYMVVCRPLGAVMFQTKHALAGVVFSWVWSFIWNTPPLFGWGSYQLEGVMTSCAPNWYRRDPVNVSYILCYFMLCFALPFATIIFSYMHLLHTLWQVAKLQVADSGSTAKVEVQVARMVVIMVMAFLLTWLPYAAFALTVIIDSNIYINPVIGTIPAYLAKSSTVFNPIIYIFMNRQFRDYALPCLLCGKNPWAAKEGRDSDTNTLTTTVSKNTSVSPL
ncbi:parapinopsin [Ictalurus punctatus]|uniref:Parapinopsin n=1 Tax=Ictalurus punctatus TaxID=7998 RepID=OPSP_ICTPU|nr:parapinopsin [Ictalurus punctatus]O42266.1 RecName: Full=Parapinopsin [Ictalurus punctatus]AAB84050.1 parapinopsin [Ictalurus punctatus]